MLCQSTLCGLLPVLPAIVVDDHLHHLLAYKGTSMYLLYLMKVCQTVFKVSTNDFGANNLYLGKSCPSGRILHGKLGDLNVRGGNASKIEFLHRGRIG